MSTLGPMDLAPARSPFRRVPARTIAQFWIIGILTYIAFRLIGQVANILIWVIIAAFFATVLHPAVDLLEKRARIRRGIAVAIVFVVGVVGFIAMLYAFIRPLIDQAVQFADDFPEYVEDAKEGRGAVGDLVQRYNLDERVAEYQDDLENAVESAREPALRIAASLFATLAALATILVMMVLMLLRGPSMLQTALNFIEPPEMRERVRHVAADCAKAVSGYMLGNLLISLIAGVTTFIALTIVGVPFSGALSLWVAFADLIPMVGATLGAIPTVAVAFLHSTTSGIIILIFYVVYQQFENHILQVTIMARTVALNPLFVLISVLIGVELLGLVGALLAIPVAGMIQVIIRDVFDERRGRIKDEPTVGADERPIATTAGGEPNGN